MNAGLKTSLPGQEAYWGLRVHYAEAWKEKPHSKRIQKSIPGSLLYGLYKVRYYDTKRVWQITSLPPLLIRLFTKQQKVLLNILPCKGGKKPSVLSPHRHSNSETTVQKSSWNKMWVCLTIFYVFLLNITRIYLVTVSIRSTICRFQEWKLIFVVLSLMM